MVRAHIWVRRKPDLSPEDFRTYWEERHAPIARDGYEFLKGYTIDFVTRVPQGQMAPYDGVATLSWDDRDGMKADLASEAGQRATDDLATFAQAFGFLFVEEQVVK